MDGAGNDFVVIDNREGGFEADSREVARMCDRRRGIGADGLMTLEADAEGDFRMRYYNSDGGVAAMCGNGGRCIALLAHRLGLGQGGELRFRADDGWHEATVTDWEAGWGVVRLTMRDVGEVRPTPDGWLVDTGVPHLVVRVADVERVDVVGEGRRLRQPSPLAPEGANVDFVCERPDGRLAIRTYERGVEDETQACGTGVTAAALVARNPLVVARGGDFRVDFEPRGTGFARVRLTGPVSLNFTGLWISSAR